MEHLPGLSCRAEGQLCEVSLIGCHAVKARMRASFIVVLHRALPDLQRMKLLLFCCRVVGTEVGILFGAIKPDL